MATYSSILAWRIPWTEEQVIVHTGTKNWTLEKHVRTNTVVLAYTQRKAQNNQLPPNPP